MILKKKNSINASLRQLKEITKLPNLPKAKLSQVEKEIKLLRSGNKGEQDSAYFIDFYFKNSRNWAVIHDLRLEFHGLVAQIDHLLINRKFDFYVLETKHYANGIKVTERGEFLVFSQNKYRVIASPVEQNKRHIKVLSNLLKKEKILPTRLGLPIQLNFLPYILVSPQSRIIRPSAKKFNTDIVIKSDKLYQQTQDNINDSSLLSDIGAVMKIISSQSLMDVARKIISYHQPIEINYYGKFGISKSMFEKF